MRIAAFLIFTLLLASFGSSAKALESANDCKTLGPDDQMIADCVLLDGAIGSPKDPQLTGTACLVRYHADGSTRFLAEMVDHPGGWPVNYLIGMPASDVKVSLKDSATSLQLIQTSGNVFMNEKDTVTLDKQNGDLEFLFQDRNGFTSEVQVHSRFTCRLTN